MRNQTKIVIQAASIRQGDQIEIGESKYLVRSKKFGTNESPGDVVVLELEHIVPERNGMVGLTCTLPRSARTAVYVNRGNNEGIF